MAKYPGAVQRPINKTRPTMWAKNILCFHTMVGGLAGTDRYFRTAGVDSHFGVGGSTDGANDGVVYQWVDTSLVAYANLNGNGEVISIETSDGGDPDRPWSPKALDALVELGVWVCKTHDIPARLINGNESGSRGIGYHRQGCDHSNSYRPRGWPYDQWRVSGGVRWSNAIGKTCPGNVRIKQLVDVVIPRIKAGMEGDDSMSAEDVKELKAYLDSKFRAVPDGVWNEPIADVVKPKKADGTYQTMAARSFFSWGRRDTRAIYDALPSLLDDEGALTKVIKDTVSTVGSGDLATIQAAFLAALRELFAEKASEESA